MNYWLLAAAALLFLVGLVHSVMGERLIFRRLRGTGFIPTDGGTILREHYVRIVWASWHLATLQGWFVAAALVWLAVAAPRHGALMAQAIALLELLCALLVMVATKGRHPGWIGLAGVAILTMIGAR